MTRSAKLLASVVFIAMGSGGLAQTTRGAPQTLDLDALPKGAPSTIAAVIDEVNRLKEERLVRLRALRAGQRIEPQGEAGFEDLVRLVETLAQSEDPVVIRPLASTFISSRAMDALAAFGELAVADVMAAVSDPEPGSTTSALRVLQQMLERPVRHPLSLASIQSIIGVAQRRLSGRQSIDVVWSAVELAVATKDPSLVDRVRRMASNDSEVKAFGIRKPEDIYSIQRWAREALTVRGLQ
jgi:hypothetical protein